MIEREQAEAPCQRRAFGLVGLDIRVESFDLGKCAAAPLRDLVLHAGHLGLPLGAVIGEFVASNKGLGHMLIQSVGSLEVPTAFAAVVVVSILGIATWYLAEWIERLAIPWHASQRGRAQE